MKQQPRQKECILTAHNRHKTNSSSAMQSLPSNCFIEPCCQLPWFDNTGDRWMNMQHWWNDTDRRNQSMPKETCLGTTVSTINHIRRGPELNLGLYSNRPVTNHLHHGTVYQYAVPERRVWLQMVTDTWSIASGLSHEGNRPFITQTLMTFK